MSKASPIQIFSFGYYGWGNSTEQLVKAVDAVERARGFRAPIFADVRIRRQGRAVGFVGTAFEDLLGQKRHRWLPKLGNRQIVSRSGPRIQIAEPEAADDLLDLALEANEDGRRVIFFCGCEFPKENGVISCHRHAVARLLLKAAARRGENIEVVEWPGGVPQHVELETTPTILRAVGKGRMTIPVGDQLPLAVVAGLPWGSTATLSADGERLHRLVGPAKWKDGEWCLPVAWWYWTDPAASLAEYERHAGKSRRLFGMEPSRSTTKG